MTRIAGPLLTLTGVVVVLIGAGCSNNAGGRPPSPSSVDAALPHRLAIAREQQVTIREPDGRENPVVRTPPSTFPNFPVWSPDGKRIAYVQTILFLGITTPDWGGDIYVIDLESKTERLLWKHSQPGEEVQGLAWTPDGASLIFGYHFTRVVNNKYEGTTRRIERLDIATGARQPLIEGAMFPSLSRDGATLAYLTLNDQGLGGLWVANPDGSSDRQLVELGPKFSSILGPRIAPDGKAIAFAAATTDGSWTGPSPWQGLAAKPVAHGLPMDIWRVVVATGETGRLTQLREDEPMPAWSPDGSQLIVMATGGLYTLPAAGGDVRKVGAGTFNGKVDVR